MKLSFIYTGFFVLGFGLSLAARAEKIQGFDRKATRIKIMRIEGYLDRYRLETNHYPETRDFPEAVFQKFDEQKFAFERDDFLDGRGDGFLYSKKPDKEEYLLSGFTDRCERIDSEDWPAE